MFTVRALRHYEEIGLLRPSIIDRETGYRYYAVGQLQKIQSITTLKSLGYSLEEKIGACKAQLEMLRERERMLKAACLKVFGAYDRLYQAYIDLFAWLEIDGIWDQEDSDKWLTIIQIPVEKN